MTESPTTRHSLLARLKNADDEAAWSEFIGIYEPLVYRLARAKGFQDADARDITQDVFAAVARAIDRWDPDPARGSFRGWLFRVARNLMINFLASKNHQLRGSGDSGFMQYLDQQTAEDTTAQSQFDSEYHREVFTWAAGQIRGEFQPDTWKAFWLTCVDGRGIEEVARDLGKNVGSIYAARSRVMARLKRKVTQVESC